MALKQNIHCLIIINFFILLLSATTIKEHFEIPEHIEISLLEYDLRIYSKLDQKPIFFNSDKNPEYCSEVEE